MWMAHLKFYLLIRDNIYPTKMLKRNLQIRKLKSTVTVSFWQKYECYMAKN